MSRRSKDSEGELTSLDLLINNILVGGRFAWAWALAYWASGNESNCPGQLDWTFFKPWTLVIKEENGKYGFTPLWMLSPLTCT